MTGSSDNSGDVVVGALVCGTIDIIDYVNGIGNCSREL